MEQLRAVWSDARLWFLSLFYFVTFGAFVALTVYLPNFLTSHYGMDGVSAGVATSVFIVAAAAIRVLGGWLGDRFDCYRLLALVFAGLAAGAAVRASIWSASHAASATAWCSSWCLRTSRSKPGLPTASWP